MLDPAHETSYTNRIVFNSMCDALLDVDQDLNFVPELATSWAWSDDQLSLTLRLRENVLFQDGEPFTADAMRLNLERYRTLPDSQRRTELEAVVGEDVIDPHTLRIRLSRPVCAVALVAGQPLRHAALAAHPGQADQTRSRRIRFARGPSRSRNGWRRTTSCWSAFPATGTRTP